MNKLLKATCLTAILGLTFNSTQVNADVILNNFAEWNGTTSISAWGSEATPTYGQTFTPSANFKLGDFSFWAKGGSAGTATDFKGLIYKWDGSSKVTGSPLATSATKTIIYKDSEFTKITVDSFDNNVELIAGTEYVFLVSDIDFENTAQYSFGALIGSSDGTLGEFFFNNGDVDFLSDFFTDFSSRDLVFEIKSISIANLLKANSNALSPESYAAFQSVGLNTLKQHRQLISNHAGRCDSTGWIPTSNDVDIETNPTVKKNLPFCIFADGGALNTSIEGSNGLSSYQSNSNIAFWGIEYTPSKQWSIGAAYGYGNSNLYGLESKYANISSNNNSGFVYAVHKPVDNLELLANFGYTKFDITGSRNVTFLAAATENTADTSADGFSTSLDAKYSIPVNLGSSKDWLVISPMLGIAWGRYQQNEFTESSVGWTALQVNSNTVDSLIGTIGFELSTTPISFGKNDSSFTPKLAFIYEVDALANSSSNKEIESSFVSAPENGTMTTQGQNGGANSFTITAGGDLKMSKNTALYASVDYQIEDNGSQLGYSGGLRFLF